MSKYVKVTFTKTYEIPFEVIEESSRIDLEADLESQYKKQSKYLAEDWFLSEINGDIGDPLDFASEATAEIIEKQITQ